MPADLAPALEAAERAATYAATRRDAFLQELMRLLRVPSIAADPPAGAMRQAADLVATAMGGRGFRTDVVETAGHPAVLAELDTGAPVTVLLYNHYDVQPADPLAAWTSEPFAPEVRDGSLFARGVADNKADLMVRLEAIGALAATGGLPVNIRWLVEGEEETGSRHLPSVVKQHADRLRADVCLWESGGRDEGGRPGLVLGCKGILYVELATRSGPPHDMHSSLAAVVPSPVWRLLEALDAIRDPQSGRVRIPGFYDAARAPTDAQRALLEKDPLDVAAMRRSLGVPRLLGNDPETPAGGVALAERLLFSPTCNICGIEAGYNGPGTKTIVPAAAQAKLDFRLVPDQRADVIWAKLTRYLAQNGFSDVAARLLEAEDPALTPADHPAVAICAELATAVYGKPARIMPLIAATGPMAPVGETLHVPCLSVPNIARPDSHAHAPDERVPLEAMWEGLRYTAAVLTALSGLGR
ncbi:MAG TPA: M20/M25/M40 family metallo-hydrolase [Bacillota bacterium]|nr:M20/M25/M40 family metallo-hydrolase [Bacillota bacterium]